MSQQQTLPTWSLLLLGVLPSAALLITTAITQALTFRGYTTQARLASEREKLVDQMTTARLRFQALLAARTAIADDFGRWLGDTRTLRMNNEPLTGDALRELESVRTAVSLFSSAPTRAVFDSVVSNDRRVDSERLLELLRFLREDLLPPA